MGIYSGIDFYRQEHLDTGELDTERLGLRLFSVDSNTQDRFFGQYTFNREILLEDFVIYRAPDGSRQVVIPPGDYSFEEFRLGVFSGNQRRVSLGGSFTTGSFYNGDQVQTNIQFNWRPSEHFRFGMTYRLNEIELPEGNFTVRLSSLRADVIFSSTLSWVNLIQYDNLSENSALRLEEMIKQHDNVRDLYLDCVQLHADLTGHFAQDPKLNIPELSSSSDSPVLGSLGDAVPGVDSGPPVAD